MTTINTSKETLKYNNEIMVICARTQAILDGDTELLDLMTSQAIDDSGKARGEFLGGNGQTQWGHCKGHIIENSGYESTGDDVTGEEHALMAQAVAEHQTSIEVNGFYNVRQLAHWKGGFNGETYAKSQARHAVANADHGYKIDHRRAPGTSKEARIAAKLDKLNAKQQRRNAKK